MLTYKPEKIHRIILKLSGEVLAGEKGFGFDDDVIDRITDDIIELRKIGLSCGIVLGGGNFFRGGTWKNKKLDRVVLDNIGMLATIQNALYLSEILRKKNYSTDVFSAIQADKIAKYYTPIRVETAFQEGRICFLCGGTGSPFFYNRYCCCFKSYRIECRFGLERHESERRLFRRSYGQSRS